MKKFTTSLLLLSCLCACTRFSANDQSLMTNAATNLYAEPDGASQVVAAIQTGDLLTDGQKTGSAEAVIERSGHVIRSPWIWITTNKGQSGWAPATFFTPEKGDATHWLNQKRLSCYFGEAVAHQCDALSQQFEKVATQEETALWLRATQRLHDSMMQHLQQRPERVSETQAAHFRWLGEVFKTHVFQVLNNGRTPWVFLDYRTLQAQVQRSAGIQDDVFIELAFHVFPQDSIESAFPAWKFQLDDERSASRLGEGRHLELLAQMDKAASVCPLFMPEIEAWKNSLIKDILGENTSYWQPASRALDELKTIESRQFTCLNEADMQVIRQRIRDFETPEASGIKADLRSGM
ncbi:MAG: hypothetical protein IT269_05915 [Saprospiraceae bacterium]|nr:hypothetical protein [Saprospiraceae bacterium]